MIGLFCRNCGNRAKSRNSVIAQAHGCSVSPTRNHYYWIHTCPDCGFPLDEEIACKQCGEVVEAEDLIAEEPKEEAEEATDWSACKKLTRNLCDDCGVDLLTEAEGVVALIGNGRHHDYHIVESVKILCVNCREKRLEPDRTAIMDASEIPHAVEDWDFFVKELQEHRFGNQFYRWSELAKRELAELGFGPPIPPF